MMSDFFRVIFFLTFLCTSGAFWSEFGQKAFEELPCFEAVEETNVGWRYNKHHPLVRSPPNNRSVYKWADIDDELTKYKQFVEQELLDPNRWIIDNSFGVEKAKEFLSGSLHELPFVQRIDLPIGAEVRIFGDLHGCFHSLLRILRSFIDDGYMNEDLEILPEHQDTFFLLFLGDYVDRGYYGLETLMTILRLKRTNPRNVFNTRGNHEDVRMNDGGSPGSFIFELRMKIPKITRAMAFRIFQVYSTFPVAAFLGIPYGTDDLKFDDPQNPTFSSRSSPARNSTSFFRNGSPRYLLGCHGGIELGFFAGRLLKRKTGGGSYQNYNCPTVEEIVDDKPINSRGADSFYALMHGVHRADWLSTLSSEELSQFPKALIRQFVNVGSRPTYLSRSTQLDSQCIHFNHSCDVPEKENCAEAEELEDPTEIAEVSPVGDVKFSSVAIPPSGDDTIAVEELVAEHIIEPFEETTRISWRKNCSLMECPIFEFLDPTSVLWDSRAWPLAPTDIPLNNGFMWNDFFVHDKATFLHLNPNRGLALGKAATAQWLRLNDVAGVLRAHQHHDSRTTGPMLSEMLHADPPGAFNNWDFSSLVVTYLSGAWVPYINNPHDSYAVLRFSSDNPAEWTMYGCANRVSPQFRLKHLSSNGVPRSSLDFEDVVPPEHWNLQNLYDHTCNPRTDFLCKPIKWSLDPMSSTSP